MLTRRLGLVDSGDLAPPAAGPIVRVAIATRDGKAVNAHFGSATRFVVYDVTAGQARLVETISFEGVSDESGTHTKEGEDRNGAKIAALSGVGLLVVQAIGGPVAARVIRARMHPIKLTNTEPIAEVITKVQELLSGPLPPWMRKIVRTEGERSMDFLDED